MRDLSKRDYSILIANTIDHFDTALYGFLAPIFAANFFPNSDPLISLILA
ncbi:MAG: MFS transporter, partial [Proteobacteria bacterium]|nr:MFS transporter [Pseudomonadota bacterium]